MALDLSGLEERKEAIAGVAAETLGKPLQLLLIDIDEDPNQPRRTFDKNSLNDMVESIRLHGVKTPVSVRSHPTIAKKWILNFGARRYRASVLAGKTTIPAFIDHQHTDYQQVIENLQRENLSPMELALFIKKKLDDGQSKADIVRSLSIHGPTVTEHLALINPPECIEEIYSTGKCTSPKTLYELRSLHGKFPKEVERWCDRSKEITRGGVTDLSAKLKGRTDKSTSKTPAPVVKEKDGDGEGTAVSMSNGHLSSSSAVTTTEVQIGEGRAVEFSVRPGEPMLLVMFQERKGRVLFSQKPQAPNGLVIEFENGEQQEVQARSCRIEQLLF
jgi:ParB family chromosome partitioning protein